MCTRSAVEIRRACPAPLSWHRCVPFLITSRDQREHMCSYDMRCVGSQNDLCGLSSPFSARARSHVHVAMAPGGGGTSVASRPVGRAERVGQLGRAKRAGQSQPVRPPDSHIPNGGPSKRSHSRSWAEPRCLTNMIMNTHSKHN